MAASVSFQSPPAEGWVDFGFWLWEEITTNKTTKRREKDLGFINLPFERIEFVDRAAEDSS
jgi:hypothetical protein